jgi:hypothetical protein
VSRFELNDPKGSPRSFSLKFGFKENEYFEDKVLEKKFWFRKSKDWAGLVSEPVLIHWKKGKDLTGGLIDAAYTLGEARRKLSIDTSDAASRKQETDLSEYKNLANKIETSQDASVSFFGIFAFVSGYRWISAEESQKVTKEDQEKYEKMKRGEMVEDDDDDEEDAQDYQEIEVFPGGDEVVTIIAEDMWPNAIKYYSMHVPKHQSSVANRLQRVLLMTTKKTTRTCLRLKLKCLKLMILWTRTTRTMAPRRSTYER